MWSIVDDYHRTGAIEVFDSNGIAVLVHYVGRYPLAAHEDGRTTRHTPYIDVAISSGSINGVMHYDGVNVTAYGEWVGGRRRYAQVFRDLDYGDVSRRDAGPGRWVALGKMHVEAASRALATLDHDYASAQSALSVAYAYDHPLSREAYLAACHRLALEPLSDERCDSYGVKYGDFAYPEYPVEVVASMHLAHLRFRSLQSERAVACVVPEKPVLSEVPIKSGQLWEPCECCGQEPCYLPLHMCDRCWPKEPVDA